MCGVVCRHDDQDISPLLCERVCVSVCVHVQCVSERERECVCVCVCVCARARACVRLYAGGRVGGWVRWLRFSHRVNVPRARLKSMLMDVVCAGG